MNNLNTAVISLGGSIIAPDKVDTTFLTELNKNPERVSQSRQKQEAYPCLWRWCPLHGSTNKP